jgi:WD40 repeat protein
MGLPITDAYWTRAKIGPNEHDVLVQLYERRVLTYVPDNPAGYKVEMGNVGQHYFQWRYPHLGQPWAAPDPSMPLLYAANGVGSDHLEVWQYLTTGSVQITGNPIHPSYVAGESVAFSYRRSYDPTQSCLLVDSRRGDGQHRQIYQQPILPLGYSDSFQNTCLPDRLTYSDGTQPPPGMPGQGAQKANDYNPSISPDGTKLVFVSDRDGAPQLYLMTANGNSYPQRLNMDGCLTQVPTWSPDGRTLYWEQQCSGGKYALMKGDLQYTDEGASWASATLTNIRALTDQGSDNRFPRVAPDGKRIAFTSYRDGNAEIYLMNADGSAVTRLTNSAGDDESASWSSNGSQLAFASNRDGDYEVYVMNTDGSGQSQLTNNGTVDRWTLWAQ